MVVLVWKCRVRLLSEPRTLKEKRAVVLKTLERMRRSHSLSAAEVGEHDMYNVACFGFCSVGTDSRKLEAIVEKARRTLESFQALEVIDEEIFFENY